MTSWQIKKLSSIGSFAKGSGIPKDSAQSGDLPAVRYGELYTSFDVFVRSTKSYIDQATAAGAAKIRKGDILFAGSGETIDEIGKSAVYTLEQEGYAGGDIVILRPDSKQSAAFLGYILNSEVARRELRRLGQGQSVVHIYRKDLESLELALPERQEQERIVSVLEVWDEYLEKLEQKIALKEELKKGLMQQLLTGKTRFHNFSGKWEKRSLGELVDITTGRKDVNQGNPKGTYPFFTCSRQHTYSDEYSFDTEAILIAGNGDVGHCKYYYGRFEAYQRTYVLTGFSKVSAQYIFPYLRHYFQSFIESQKQMGAMPFIKVGMLRDFQINLPVNDDERHAIAELINNADSEVFNLRQKLSLVREQKSYLLKNLITGTIRTPKPLTRKEVN